MSLIEKITKKILNHKKVLLMFDYDGTLTPIVDKPEMAKLDPQIKTALEIIAKDEVIKVAIISGRDIETVKKLSGITSTDIIFFGLHGGQALIEGKICDYSSEANKNEIQEISKILENKLNSYKGIIIENKELSVAVHYRQAEQNAVDEVIKTVNDVFKSYNFHNEFILQLGKKVLEILPAGFTKDKAVNRLITSFADYFPVYFGDDITDISAFKETIKHNGFGISVGAVSSVPINEISQIISFEQLNEFIINTARNKIQCKLEVI